MKIIRESATHAYPQSGLKREQEQSISDVKKLQQKKSIDQIQAN